jgi:hypothetical protein
MRWFAVVLLIAIAWIGFHFGENIDLEKQWTFYEALRTTTSVVFGILGALLAIVYPEVIKQGLRPSSGVSLSDPDVHRVTDPLAYSALLLVVLVLAAPVFAWLQSLGFEKKSAELLLTNRTAFAVLCALSYGQVCILMAVLNPLGVIVGSVNDSTARARLRRGIHQNGPAE